MGNENSRFSRRGQARLSFREAEPPMLGRAPERPSLTNRSSDWQEHRLRALLSAFSGL